MRTIFQEGHRVIYTGLQFMSGVPNGTRGVVRRYPNTSHIFTDPGHTLIAVEWEKIGMIGVKEDELKFA